jgi:predicted GNAT family acetyltransferase
VCPVAVDPDPKIFMHPLDNVIWKALTTRQSEFAETFNQARRFPREINGLTALQEPDAEGYASLSELVGKGGTALLSLAKPYDLQPGWELILAFPGLQMVCEDREAWDDSNAAAFALEELGKDDSPAMVELATLTKPGPFGTRSHELGFYAGIRCQGKLVAMAGERLKVPGFTEVSAVCTHPEHTGKGYAQSLMIEVMRRIRERGEVPFLHVRQENTRAVGIYEKLGFRTRKVVHFVVIRRTA